jgi:predicted RNA-binding protein with TRAM domain
MQNSNPPPPVQIGELIAARIESLGAKGDGIIRKGRYIIIVKSTGLQIGDDVEVKIDKVLPNFALASPR